MLSKFRYCLTKEGKVVLDSDVNGVSLLVGEGCEIDEKDIAKYGFVNGEIKPKKLPVQTKEDNKAESNIIDLRDKENSKGK